MIMRLFFSVVIAELGIQKCRVALTVRLNFNRETASLFYDAFFFTPDFLFSDL